MPAYGNSASRCRAKLTALRVRPLAPIYGMGAPLGPRMVAGSVFRSPRTVRFCSTLPIRLQLTRLNSATAPWTLEAGCLAVGVSLVFVTQPRARFNVNVAARNPSKHQQNQGSSSLVQPDFYSAGGRAQDRSSESLLGLVFSHSASSANWAHKTRWLNCRFCSFFGGVNSLNLIAGALATLSCLLIFWQWLAAKPFALNRKEAIDGFAPPISILKPLKGCDETTAASLQSWFQQHYPGPVEILFAVAETGDPVCDIVRQLMAEHPALPARLVICDHLAGANAKAAKLARLEALAAHDLILISDADVRVRPDFLRNFVAPLRDARVGLVNCFYRLANPVTLAMRWEAVAVNADFWSQVLQARQLKPMDFALGAAILLRRDALTQIGGFKTLANCLADDYQLGRRIAGRGNEIALSTHVVECWDSAQTWEQVWKHQLRWGRTIRVCRPAAYFFSLLSNGSLWPLLWVVVAACTQANAWEYAAALGCLAVRIGLTLTLLRRFGPGNWLRFFWLVPLRDLLQVAIWLAAFLGGTIEWRGRKMKVLRDGTLASA